MKTPDRIQKKIVLRAPLARVWSAISDASQFGIWFGADLEGPFVAGQPIRGAMRPTQVDPDVAKMQEPYTGQPFHGTVETIEPMRLISFRWHPYAIDPEADHSKEPTTLVEFALEEVDGGTQLTVTESGFDKVPLERRAEAFKSNEEGWEHQTKLLEKYLRAQS